MLCDLPLFDARCRKQYFRFFGRFFQSLLGMLDGGQRKDVRFVLPHGHVLSLFAC